MFFHNLAPHSVVLSSEPSFLFGFCVDLRVRLSSKHHMCESVDGGETGSDVEEALIISVEAVLIHTITYRVAHSKAVVLADLTSAVFRLSPCTLSPKMTHAFFSYSYPKNSSRTETLHTESDVYELIHYWKNSPQRYKIS